ncbi:MAG: desulfoferrodoxin [Elusimicrobiaceae bacterium]|nr:desulfoferrodoxin [Elusimicrobiaceae bacterium]
MAKLHDIYKCKVCGQMIEVVHEGAGALICCGQPMQHQAAGTTDGAAEKHVPVIEKIEGGYKVKVGSVAHPMIDVHWIEFIELICEKCGKVQRKYLKPGDAPEAVFKTDAQQVTAREYCNIHGLWEAKN